MRAGVGNLQGARTMLREDFQQPKIEAALASKAATVFL
jgi:hypothetical protein